MMSFAKNIAVTCIILILIHINIGRTFAQLHCNWDRSPSAYLIKTNLLNFAFKSFNLEVEKTLLPKANIGVSVAYTPTRDIPFKERFLEKINNERVEKTIDEALFNQFSITPYIRFYVHDASLFSGLYLAPYLKYTRYSTEFTLHYNYQKITDNSVTLVEIPIDGNLNSLSIGSSIGYQINAFKNLFLDLKIIGNHYGILFGKASGNSNLPLSQSIQDDIREQLDNVEKIPTYSIEHEITENHVEIKPKGLNIGITSSFSIGYRF